MDEISGIVYYKPQNAIIAINDEKGRLYSISLENTWNYQQWKFAKGGDYEEIVFTGTEWYVLKSNGELYLLQHIFTDSMESTSFPLPASKAEFEAVFYRASDRSLIVLCKVCRDVEDKGVPAFAFDTEKREWRKDISFSIDTSRLNRDGVLGGKSFRPSAVAVNPLNGNLFIVSAINRLLLITDQKGTILGSHELNPDLFLQPEGISFDEKGNIYISNEATDNSEGNILLFNYSGGA